MTLVFWQNIISIHQKTFLEEVANRASVDKVILVVEDDMTPYRKTMGWDVPDIANVEIIRAPLTYEIQRIVRSNKDAVHIMGGIRVGRVTTIALEACIKYNCRMGVMTEPYDSEGWKGKLRRLKYRGYAKKYFQHIQFVLAIGRQGVSQYTDLGFDTARLFSWAYFISVQDWGKRAAADHAGQRRIIYAGRLGDGKGIYRFIKELIDTGHKNYKLDLYGTGPDEEIIKDIVAVNGLEDRIHFYAFLKYDELLRKYTNYDWVVLPSTAKDGWGVIISEGLLYGLKAVCSNICGVSRVVKNGFNGEVFNWAEEGSCAAAIENMFKCTGYASSADIEAWANKGLSAAAGAEYLMSILGNVYHNGARPGIPWE